MLDLTKNAAWPWTPEGTGLTVLPPHSVQEFYLMFQGNGDPRKGSQEHWPAGRSQPELQGGTGSRSPGWTVAGAGEDVEGSDAAGGNGEGPTTLEKSLAALQPVKCRRTT